MEELIKQTVAELLRRVETEMPETGSFEMIDVGFDNPDKRMVTERFWFSVLALPKTFKDSDTVREMRMRARRRESGRVVSLLAELCPKQELMAKLRDPKLVAQAMEDAKLLDYHLIDLH